MNALTPIASHQAAVSGIHCLGLPAMDIERGRISVTIREGSTVAEIVSALFPDLSDARRGMVRVTIGEWVIHQHTWLSVRPKPGMPVVARIIPQGGNLRSVLSIVVTIASIAAGQFYLGPLIAGATGLGAQASAAIGTAIVAFAGNLLLNALIPIKAPKADEPSYNVNGWRHQLIPGAPFASVLGRLRIAPNFAAFPFTQTIGEERYITALFAMRGRVETSGYRLGETSIADEIGGFVSMEVKLPGDGPVSLYRTQVIEDQVGQELSPSTPIKRTSAADAEELSIDFHFPAGLFDVKKNGDEIGTDDIVQIDCRLVGTDTWIGVATLEFRAKTHRPFFRTHRWAMPSRGRYEVRVTRTNDYNERGADRVDWLCLRAHRPEYPLNVTDDLTMIAVRVQASKLTNGTLDTFNFIAEGTGPDWDAATQTWVTRKTRNPASHYRRAHQSTENRMPKPDAKLYLEQMQQWHEMCVAKGLNYDRLHDYKARFDEVLDDICRAGRATKQNTGSKWGVCIDQPRTAVVAHIGARNSWDFSGNSPKLSLPDAFSVKFNDETNDYEQAERVVPRPGLVDLPVTIEALSQEGITNPSAIWRYATRRFLELIHRRESWTCQQDVENLIAIRGDLVRLGYFREQTAGRVTAVSGNLVVMDEQITMRDGQSYVCRFRPNLVDEENEGSWTLLRSVAYHAGTRNSFVVSGNGAMPKVGDLAFFGVEGAETEEAIVKDVEMGEEMTARLTLVPHAPQIDALLDAMIVPAWDGRVGFEVEDSTVPPAVPIISRIDSGIDAQQSGGAGYPAIRVYVQPGSLTPAVGSFRIDHRLQGNVTWSTINVLAAEASATLAGYSKGQVVEVMAMAVGRGATPLSSAFSSIATHTVGANDPTAILPPAISTFTFNGTSVQIAWTNTNDPDVFSARVYRWKASQTFAQAVAITGPIYSGASASPAPVSDSPGFGDWVYGVVVSDESGFRASLPVVSSVVTVIGPELVANGGFDSTASWTVSTGITISGGTLNKAAGADNISTQPIALVAGQTYRVTYTVLSRTGGSARIFFIGGASNAVTADHDAKGTFTEDVLAQPGNNTLWVYFTSGPLSVDNVSVRRIG